MPMLIYNPQKLHSYSHVSPLIKRLQDVVDACCYTCLKLDHIHPQVNRIWTVDRLNLCAAAWQDQAHLHAQAHAVVVGGVFHRVVEELRRWHSLVVGEDARPRLSFCVALVLLHKLPLPAIAVQETGNQARSGVNLVGQIGCHAPNHDRRQVHVLESRVVHASSYLLLEL